ncbi:MAG: hypothetical protein VW577_05510 [Pelagibacteraceae bacterium]
MSYFIDPPAGWRYGFPRAVSNEVMAAFLEGNYAPMTQFFLECGYPEKDIDLALNYSRYWLREKE